MISIEELAGMIDHTNVNRDATEEDLKNLCREADDYNFSCVCVTPTNAALARELLENSDTEVCVVIGFPFGVQTPHAKAFEAGEAVDNGTSELDMVLNIGALKSGQDSLVQADIAGVVRAARGRVVKVILETAILTRGRKNPGLSTSPGSRGPLRENFHWNRSAWSHCRRRETHAGSCWTRNGG